MSLVPRFMLSFGLVVQVRSIFDDLGMRLCRSPIVLLERAWLNVARAVTEFLFFA